MAYPAYRIAMEQSARDIIDDLQIDPWPNGGARGRSFADSERYVFTLVHPYLSQSEADALDAFYWANRTAPFDFLDRWAQPSVTRNNCIFLERPNIKRLLTANHAWTATVKIRMR
jgi:hypothetical protein